MAARLRPANDAATGHYWTDEGTHFVPSGCTVLDCVLGGGWPLGRIANVVGDKAVGKTLLAIEACANFARTWPDGRIWYREVEAAFDVRYAEKLGLPSARVEFGPDGVDTSWETVEDIFEDLDARLAEAEADLAARLKKTRTLEERAAEKLRRPGLYIVDSLDALSSREELKRKIDKGSYGTDKASVMSELFRRLKKRIKATNTCVIVVSQLRDKIGVMFGEKQTRTGGRALDFYASQILWLHHKGTLTSTARGVERATAVRIRARCKKNKIGPAHRECEFVLRFGYGVDDFEAAATFLGEVGALDSIGISAKSAEERTKAVGAFLRASARLAGPELRARQSEIAARVREAWAGVEARFDPPRRKYE